MRRHTIGLTLTKNKKGCRIATTLVSFYNMVDEMSDSIAQLVQLVTIIVSLFLRKSIQ